jgi:hypothetical protein
MFQIRMLKIKIKKMITKQNKNQNNNHLSLLPRKNLR